MSINPVSFKPNPTFPTIETQISKLNLNSSNAICEIKKETKLTPLQEKFIVAAQARLDRKPFPEYQLPDQNNALFTKAVNEALNGQHDDSFQGGEHKWVSTRKLPNLIFKWRINIGKQTMSERYDVIEKARKICEKHDLYLLYVPKCAVLDSKPSVLLEEKLAIPSHDWNYHKNFYKWALNEPSLQNYFKELFRQLVIFVCKMEYTDVKYSNLPFTLDGRVGLIDLDCDGPGLVGCRKPHGLFYMISLKWYDEFSLLAYNNLPENQREEYKKSLDSLKVWREAHEKKKSDLQLFYQKKGDLVSKEIQIDPSRFAELPTQIFEFSKMIVFEINQSLPYRTNLRKGREFKFRDTDLPYKAFEPDYWKFRLDIVPKGLEILKEMGYLFSYRIDSNTSDFQVIC